ncbi:AAA family ATPase [Rhodococcus sp. NPDC049939]|uniref:bifunctional aminoglycoside phosphotransferase/ATP-binding protein n=1 Tax=Rhodococcus sp. NPDC049939 TaxID=3155511 RepID=UPI0033C15F35
MTNDRDVIGAETHTAFVVMVGDFVFKVKKPIKTAFLDFSTADKRRAACEREVALNKRLCPDVYLGVAELTDPGGGESEPLVKMRRMPVDRRLSVLATGNEDPSSHLDAIADLVARFHASAERSEEIDCDATADVVAERWRGIVSQVIGYRCGFLSSSDIDEIDWRARRYLDGRKPLFECRIRDHYIVDGHGDLLADDIFCLADGPRILDCLDFDDHLRHVDCIDDVACLAMDLDYLGREDLASRFLDRYCAVAQDAPPRSLRHHYIAYRAFVRAMVACLRYTQGAHSAREDARKHIDLAVNHLRAGTVRLGLVGGLPGTGKSTLSRRLAERTDAIVISSDQVRKELAGVDPQSRQGCELGQGLYGDSMTENTYSEMLRRASANLSVGHSVILDASWTQPVFREHAAAVASRNHSDLVELQCTTPRDVAIERIETRPPGISDATAPVYDAMSLRAAAWASAAAIDTTVATDESLKAAEQIWDSSSRSRRG